MRILGFLVACLDASLVGCSLWETESVVFHGERLIAEGETDPEAYLGLALDVALAGDEVFIADVRDPGVKVYDRFGQFRRRIGRVGPGPGEWRTPPAAIRVRGDTLVVLEGTRLRFLDVRSGQEFRVIELRQIPPYLPAFDYRDGHLIYSLLPIVELESLVRSRWPGGEAEFGEPKYLRRFPEAVRRMEYNAVLMCLTEDGGVYLAFREFNEVGRYSADGTRRSRFRVPDLARTGRRNETGLLVSPPVLIADLEPVGSRVAVLVYPLTRIVEMGAGGELRREVRLDHPINAMAWDRVLDVVYGVSGAELYRFEAAVFATMTARP